MSEKAREFYKNFLLATHSMGVLKETSTESLAKINFPAGFLEQFERVGCHEFLKDMDKIENINIKFKEEDDLIDKHLKEYFIKNRLEKVLYYDYSDNNESEKFFLDKNLNRSKLYNNIKYIEPKDKEHIVNILWSLIWKYGDDFNESRINRNYYETKGKNRSFLIFDLFFDDDNDIFPSDYFNNFNLNYRKDERVRALEAISNSLLPDKAKLMSLMNDAIDFYKKIYELHDSDYIKFMIKHCDVINNPDNKDIVYIISQYIVLFDIKLLGNYKYYSLLEVDEKIMYKLLLLVNENSLWVQQFCSIRKNLLLLGKLAEKYIYIKLNKYSELYIDLNDILEIKIDKIYFDIDLDEACLYNTKDDIKIPLSSLTIVSIIKLLSYL